MKRERDPHPDDIEDEKPVVRKRRRLLSADTVQENFAWAKDNPNCKDAEREWPREEVPNGYFDRDIDFMNMDIHYSLKEPWSETSHEAARMHGFGLSKIPVIYIHGLTDEGHSVTTTICGVFPYFYVPVPTPYIDRTLVDDGVLCESFRDALNDVVGNIKHTTERVVLEVSIIVSKSIWRYNTERSEFFKITLSSPQFITTARNVLEKDGLSVRNIKGRLNYKTYEANIAFVVRYMIDADINGASWMRLVKGRYKLIEGYNKLTRSQIEIEVLYDPEDRNIIALNDEEDPEWMKIAPMRILSFDIECCAKKGFPKAEFHPVIQIANIITRNGETEPFIRNVFVLGECTDIIGVDVRCFETEIELLKAWRQFIIETDPDILTGYNIVNFDIGYLFDRAKKLGIKNFSSLTRLTAQKTYTTKETFSSAQRGTRESQVINMYGRTLFDLFQVISMDYKLSSYTLNNVSSHFLKQQKEDVHYSIISVLHEGSPDDRKRLAAYCYKDAVLPQRLLNKLMSLTNYVEMARVTGVPFSFLITKGQSIKVLSQVYRKTRAEDFLIPTQVERPPPFEGAQVVDPKAAFYEEPITTLDFTSLYPSIMIAHNLCYTTLLTKQQAESMDENDYYITPDKAYFVKESVTLGILPGILKKLLSTRSQVKEQMAIEKDPFKKMVLNGRQLALKVSCNSVYGFTGALNGKLPCIEISSSTTSYGRQMLDITIDVIRSEYTVNNGYPKDADIIYGDTDSVMINFGVSTVSEAINLGKEAAKLVTTKFIEPISLEFEKVYHPYLLIAKKRYAGLLFSSEDLTKSYIDVKGIETVRRDSCGLVRHTINTCLKKILKQDSNSKENVEEAKSFVQSVIKDLLCNRIDMSLLVVTKSLSRDPAEYATQQPHSALAMRMKQRDPETAPVVGDRVPYVIVSQGKKSGPIYEKSEDPIYAMHHGLTVDATYYLEKQLGGPLERLFSPFLKNPRDFFMYGSHTTQVMKSTGNKQGLAGISGFFTEKKACLVCNAPLPSNWEKPLCKSCLPNSAEIYQKYLSTVRVKEREFSRLWTQCQDCQGSLTQEVLCESKDCPIFYMRTQVKHDLGKAITTLDKFEQIDW